MLQNPSSEAAREAVQRELALTQKVGMNSMPPVICDLRHSYWPLELASSGHRSNTAPAIHTQHALLLPQAGFAFLVVKVRHSLLSCM